MLRIGVLAALLLAAVGCGGGDPCAGSPCPNDAKRSASEYQQCVSQHQANQNKACNQQSVQYELCFQSSTVCDSNGRTDAIASYNKASTNCKAAQDALICCSFPFGSCK
jgi:hypothetical protein